MKLSEVKSLLKKNSIGKEDAIIALDALLVNFKRKSSQVSNNPDIEVLRDDIAEMKNLLNKVRSMKNDNVKGLKEIDTLSEFLYGNKLQTDREDLLVLINSSS